MDARIHLPGTLIPQQITITGSKSETNRLLLLQALYPGLKLANASVSDDSHAMLNAINSDDDVIDVGHAGTAMRFLTAYFAMQDGRKVVLTGSQRMQERPIAILVNALRNLGADIMYADKEGYPPLSITGRELPGGKLNINANVSSQYITALLLIAAKLRDGLELTLEGNITSRPYIEMTLSLLEIIGIPSVFQDNTITISPSRPEILNLNSEIEIESDWSSASYFYSVIALAQEGAAVTLSSYKKDSLQGDSHLAAIYRNFGVATEFGGTAVTIRKTGTNVGQLSMDLSATPDIAQTIAVTCLGLGIGCALTGLHTLRIKETDRLLALQTELSRFGAAVAITGDSLAMQPVKSINSGVAVNTYNDHRMAMAFAPLAAKVPVIIKDMEVVSKSYPAFWEDLQKTGFIVNIS